MEYKRLHPELIYDTPSPRQVAKNEDLIIDYVQSALLRGIINFRKQQKIIYASLSDLIDAERDNIKSHLRAAFDLELYQEYPEVFEAVLELFFVDVVMVETLFTDASYHINPHRNFIMTPKFWSDFKQVDLDSLRFSDLYQGSGYVYFQEPLVDHDGSKYHHYYFAVGNIENLLGLKRHRACKKEEPSSTSLMISLHGADRSCRVLGLQMPLDSSVSVKDFYKGATEIIYDMRLSQSIRESFYDSFTANILNTLAYIQSGFPDIVAFKNTIQYQGTTPVRKHRHLSTEILEIIGSNWEVEDRNLTEDSWLVRSHFRWQRYGAGLSKVKFINIKSHEKSWKKTRDTSEEASLA